MRRRTLFCGATVAVAMLLVTGQVVSQDKPAKPADAKQESTGEMDAMMQQWAKYAQPGEHHTRLQPLAGR